MTRTEVFPAGFGIGATAELARLAFASDRIGTSAATIGPRHLAFLPPEALDLDLSDPAQRDFGVYELLEKIGQGGMGVVYRARQKALDREVALKLLAAGPWASTDFISRFQQEAQSAARMEHPNIVTVFETGSHEDLHYFSMRLVRGQSLAARLRDDGPYSPVAAARLMRTIAEAVDYAHRLGVLHLDLKPGNILIDEHGEPLVADFGLARRLDEVLAEQSSEVSGTPSYMAPEQAQAHSQKIGMATDIYGLGAIFYELLTGVPPFLAATPQETLQRVVSDAVQSPCERRAGIPADLEAICLKCLAKDPDARYPQSRQLAEDLGRFLEGRAVSVRPLNAFQRMRRWARREPRLALAVAASVLALIAGLAATSQQWRRAEGNAESSRNLLWQSRREAALRMEQDGKGYEALPQLLANITEQQRAGKDDAVALEQRRVGMLLGQGATLIDRTVVADANPLGAEISPDGNLLALSFNDQSVRWYDTATLTERGRVSLADRVASDDQRRAILLLRFVDNHRLRATFEWFSNRVSPSDDETWLVDLDNKTLIFPPTSFASLAVATYSADGRTALLRNHKQQMQLWQVPQDTQTQWRPLSALVAEPDGDFLPWLLDSRGRFAAYLTVAMRDLVLYDLPDLSTPHTIDLPHNAGISSWALSRDGRVLALGDYEGRIFLLDTVTHNVRTLPTTRGREITWITFSEDDAWLATASFDGAVHVYEAASGDSLVFGQMNHDFAVQRVGLSHDKRLLIAAGDGRTALWHLPLRGPRAVPAQLVGFGPAPHGLSGRYPIGWSLQAGLLASSGMDGQVRLWRLPAAPLLPAMSARQIPDQTWFDGRRLVDVEWDRLRIVAGNGAALTPWIQLPQPPGFAELLDNGRLLVTTTGPQLRIFDAVTLRPRFPPIALDASPQRLLANADGSRVLLSFGGSGPDGFQERLQLYNALTGMRLPGEAVLRGPVRHFAFSTDGTRILAVGPAEASTSVLATTGLHRIGEFPHDPYEPVKWADFSADGNVVMVSEATDARQGNDTLLTWDPAKDRVVSKQQLGQARAFGVIATDAGAFVTGNNRDVLVPGVTGSARSIERLARSEPLAVLALSPDRHLLAHAFRREVQLYDVDTAVAIGPPLQGDSDAIDVIAQMAFSPDGGKLLARTVHGHWLLWPISTEQRTAKNLGTQLTRLRIDNENQQTVFMPSAGERAALRARDPGPWLAADIRPVPARVAFSEEGLPIPARGPDTSPSLLDLSQLYDFAPDSVRNTYYNIVPSMRPMPVGVQRMAGVDYDVRGMMQLGAVVKGAPMRSIRCLALPLGPLAALRPLVMVSLGSPAPAGQVLAHMTLRYADGGNALLPIRAGQEVPGYAGNDLGVPLVYDSDNVLYEMGLDVQGDALSAPRLVNPQPQRPVRCLDLDADTAVLLLLGITTEPASPAAVISPSVFRTTIEQDAVSKRPAAKTAPTSARR